MSRFLKPNRFPLHKLRKKRGSKVSGPYDDESLEPFDYYGLVPTSFPVEIGQPKLIKFCHDTFIQRRAEAGRRPKPESRFFYIWDTASYEKLCSLTPSQQKERPLVGWAKERLKQCRLYTTCEEPDRDAGWLPWSNSREEIVPMNQVLCKYMGLEMPLPDEFEVALCELAQVYTGMEGRRAPEMEGVFVTGCRDLHRLIGRQPEFWLRFERCMQDHGVGETDVLDILNLRQVVETDDLDAEPKEFAFDEMLPLELVDYMEGFERNLGCTVDSVTHTLPDWYDEFPFDPAFWESLPDAKKQPWDRKHEWFKLHRPTQERLVYLCDLQASNILNTAIREESELGKWAAACLDAGKLYVRDWKSPGRKGMPSRESQLVKKDAKGWKTLPWPDDNSMKMEGGECPALSKAAWPILDYRFIVDRYLKEIVFVTGDPGIAGELANPLLRNWLLGRRDVHVVHDIRQVYACEQQPAQVSLQPSANKLLY